MKPVGALRRSRSGDSAETWAGFGKGGGGRERSGSADSGGSFDFITDLLPGKRADTAASDGELVTVGGLQQEAEATRKAPRRGRRRQGTASPNDPRPTAATKAAGTFSDNKRRHSFDNLLSLTGLRSAVAIADSRKVSASKALSDELVCISSNSKKMSKQIVHVGGQMKKSNIQAASMVLADDTDFKTLQKRLRETGAVTITGVEQFLTASLRQQVLEAELSRDAERLRRMSGGVHGMRPSIPRDVSIAMLDVGGKATNLKSRHRPAVARHLR